MLNSNSSTESSTNCWSSIIDETKATCQKIAKQNKTSSIKTHRLRKTLLNEKLLENYFVFRKEKNDSLLKYRVLADQDSLVGIEVLASTPLEKQKVSISENPTCMQESSNQSLSILDQLWCCAQQTNSAQQQENLNTYMPSVPNVQYYWNNPYQTNDMQYVTLVPPIENQTFMVLYLVNYLAQQTNDQQNISKW